MKIHLSFDYELFFGAHSGTLEKCILEPTNKLRELAKKHKTPFIFFIDAGYIYQLKKNIENKFCLKWYQQISAQIKQLHDEGHEIALHVHPHWEDCTIENDNWKMITSRYKLADYTKQETKEIITKYHSVLTEITGVKCKSYRAGGWCIQPFEHIKEGLINNELLIDSSVYFNGFHESPAHSYDFRNCPDKTEWKFDNDCCVENANGKFKEIAITGDLILPTFYMNLYLKMKSNPEYYRPVGDGSWLKDKFKIYKQFYSSTNHFACADGYFASRLKQILIKQAKSNKNRMMVLSHPKSLAQCSFDLLDEFINFAKEKGHHFTVLKNEA